MWQRPTHRSSEFRESSSRRCKQVLNGQTIRPSAVATDSVPPNASRDPFSLVVQSQGRTWACGTVSRISVNGGVMDLYSRYVFSGRLEDTLTSGSCRDILPG